MIKYKEYLNHLNKLLEKNPNIGELPIIYSHDDEGNEYQKVMNYPTLALVDNIQDDRFLEVVAAIGNSLDVIDIAECNCIIIN